ncbi:hypothetical protein SCP_1800470 [Sparassis crispa]|uniref:Uncharacterized protein n=1 Tax=Sparassis crispa TaxID=139825 RepID=A0A401H6F9_9APHY|nr:hypothetical protein SCP_1800470 [Sparassis crispa]GBE90025.1 hypothetical protein SCP_1800470 [Sparassis crispa]
MARKKRTANFEQYTVLDVSADGTKSYTHYLGPPQRDIVWHTEYVSGGNKVTAQTSFYSTPTTNAGGQSAPSFDLSELCGPASSEVVNEDIDLFDLDAKYLEDMEKLSGQTPR